MEQSRTSTKKSFVKHFLSCGCRSEFVGSKAGLKIIKFNNITEDFILKDLWIIEISLKIV